MLSAVSLRELQLRRENTRSVCENRGAYAGSAAISQSESWPSATDLGAADQDFVRDSGCPTIRKIVPATSTPPITHAMSRIMALSFAVRDPSRSRAKRSAFKAKLNVGLRRSQNDEAATSYRGLSQNTGARERLLET